MNDVPYLINFNRFFDEDGNLKEGDYLVFPDTKTLNKKVKDWIHLNPQPNLLNEFQVLILKNYLPSD